MMSNSKYDPGAGQALPRETRYIAPSAAAREAAPTRRDERAEREEEHRRRSFLVTNGEDWRQWYGPTLFEILDGVPDLFEPTRDFTTDDVVADVVRRFDLPSMDDVDFDGDEEDGFAGQDVAIWRDGKVLAVVRRGADGRPEATRFDAAADATEWGSMTSDRPPGRGGSEASDPIRAKLRRLRHRLGAIDRRHDERSGA